MQNLVPLFLVIGAIVAGVFALWIIHSILTLRSVVSTNDVHIVQRGKRTVSYGKDQADGNVYYAWPSWLPLFIKAEGEKQKTVTIAEGQLAQAKLNAEGVRAEGEAKGAAVIKGLTGGKKAA